MPERRGPLDRAAENEADRELIESVARAIVVRGMAAPAILMLESSKPLSFLGSQALHFLEPFVRTLFDATQFSRLARALENRDNIERLLVRIEALDDEARAARKRAKP
ncbi:MAG: hypothetical protein ACKVU1_18450 [bacterium]